MNEEQLPPGHEVTCHVCKGLGEVFNVKPGRRQYGAQGRQCPECHGKKTVPEPSVPAQGEAVGKCILCEKPGRYEEKDSMGPEPVLRWYANCNCVVNIANLTDKIEELRERQLPNPSHVAPSGGEEEGWRALDHDEKPLAGDQWFSEANQQWMSIHADKQMAACFYAPIKFRRFRRSAPPTPTPAEAPTPRTDAKWNAIVDDENASQTPGGTHWKSVAIRMCQEMRVIESELSAMRQEGDLTLQQGRCERCCECGGFVSDYVEEESGRGRICRPCETAISLRQMLATVTAERDELRDALAKERNLNDLTTANADKAIAERDTALASAESARKDGEDLDWLESFPFTKQYLQYFGLTWFHAGQGQWQYRTGDTLRAAIRAARLTSEGGR